MRHPALAQQHHLDALTLLGGYFPSQRCFQPPDLALGAFDHLFPSESDDLSESHLASRRQFTATFGTRYPKHFDSISYGSGIMMSPDRCAPPRAEQLPTSPLPTSPCSRTADFRVLLVICLPVWTQRQMFSMTIFVN